MGIGINVGSNQDYSYLFGSSSNLNFLSDYAAIKNGSYGKLMKSYYGATSSSSITASGSKTSTSNVIDKILEEKKNPTVSKETQEANANLTTGISSLMTSVTKLQNDSTYKASEDGTSAADKVVSAIKDYVSQYNDVVSTAKKSTLTGATSHVAGMMNATKDNAEKLAEIGITVNGDGTLQLNESKLRAADISKVQELFSKDNVTSYGSAVKSRLGFAGVSASASSASSKETDSAKEDEVTYAGAADLKKDIEKLLSDSLFEKVKGKDGKEQYDVDKLFAAFKNFVGNYNSMLDSAKNSLNSGVISNLASILEKTAQNKDALAKFGINVDGKGKLTIDEETFKKADMSQLQKFFKDYGSSIATNVSLVNYYMTTQANAASGYTANGTYNTQENFLYNITT